MRRARQSLVEPLVVSWGWRPEKPGPSRFVQEQEWQGTREIAAYLAVPAAIQFMQEHDWERVRAECHALACYVQERIGALTGLAPLSPPDWFAQMVSVPLPPCDAEWVKTRLYDEFHIEVPIVRWNGREFVRVSVQGYNPQADLDALASALGELLAQPH